jgi:hypothetical protein
VLEDALAIPAEGVDELMERIHGNLMRGSIRFVVVMDSIDERLRRLITFVNRSSEFTILGVELEVYERGEVRIMIPNLFGAEAKIGQQGRTAWTVERFREAVHATLDKQDEAAVLRLLQWIEDSQADPAPGAGGSGSINPKFPVVSPKSIFTLKPNGRVELNFDYVRVTDPGRRFLGRLVEDLNAAGMRHRGAPFAAELKHPALPVEEWSGRVDTLVAALDAALVAAGAGEAE